MKNLTLDAICLPTVPHGVPWRWRVPSRKGMLAFPPNQPVAAPPWRTSTAVAAPDAPAYPSNKLWLARKNNKEEQEVMADEREYQTAMKMVENAAQKEGEAVENHETGREQETDVVEDVKGDAMDIDDKGKLETGKGTKENEKAEDEEIEEAEKEVVEAKEKKDKEDDMEEEEEGKEQEEEEEENGTSMSTKKRPGRVKKERAKSEEISTPRGSSGKRQRQRKEIFPYFTDRPTRERKSIERFIASVEKDTNKDVQILKGEGTPFKDIPNVVYKLSKISKNDEILSMLHSLLFHKRGKAAVLKQHILQFSGYVWTENQEKERARVKEKLERYTKEGLILLIDVLDLHLPRTGKKEELVGKVLEFLQKPHKTTDISLEEKEQEKQLKSARKRSSGKKTPGRSPKKSKIDGESSTKRGRRKAAEESDDGESAKSEDNDSLEEEEEEEVEKKRFTFKEEDEDFDEEETEKKRSTKKSSNPSSKKSSKQPEMEVESEQEEEEKSEPEEAPPKKSRKKTPAKISAPDSPTVSSKPVEKVYIKNARKQNKENEKERQKDKKEKEKERKEREKEKENKVKVKTKENEREISTPRRGPGRPRKSDVTPSKSVGTKNKSLKSPAKDKDLAQGKKSDMVKDSKPRKSKKVPSDDELQSEIRELLKDADFSKVTFTDVITQLEEKFGVSLTEQKSHVKKLIKEEINKLADDGDDEAEAGAGSPREVEGEADPGADAEMEGEPEPESEIETETEAVTEVLAKPEQKEPEEEPEPEQEEKPEIQAEADADTEALEAQPVAEAEAAEVAAKVNAEASQAGAGPLLSPLVTGEVADMVVEAGTRPKPGSESTPTLEAEAEENMRLNGVAEPELKTAAKEMGKTEEIVEEKKDGSKKAAAEPKESIEQMVEGDQGE